MGRHRELDLAVSWLRDGGLGLMLRFAHGLLRGRRAGVGQGDPERFDLDDPERLSDVHDGFLQMTR
jgi:hypothetical protein